MVQNEEYIQFDIKALLFHILRQWKPVVVWGLLIALLLGGWRAYAEYNTTLAAGTGDSYWLEYQQYQDQIATYEDYIAVTQSRLDTLEKYIDESVLMRLDPRDSYRAKAVYYVDSGYQILPENTYQDTDKTYTLSWYYRRHVTDYSVLEEIAAKIGLDTKYLVELVEVSIPNNGTVTISVRYPDPAGATMILDMMQEQMDGAQKALNASIGSHTLTLMEDSCGVYIDDSLRDLQKQADEEVMDLKEDLLEYAEELLEIKEGPAPDELNVVSAFIKWFIVGGVLGAVLVVAYLLVKSLTSNRIYAPSQLVSGFQTDVLGEVICSGAALPHMTRKLNGLEGCLAENSEGNLEFLAEKLKSCCGEAVNIAVCCDTDSQVNCTVAEELSRYLPAIHLQPVGNLLKEAAALRTLAECDAVVMVVERDKSRNTTIQKLLKVLSSYQKELLGFIVSY